MTSGPRRGSARPRRRRSAGTASNRKSILVAGALVAAAAVLQGCSTAPPAAPGNSDPEGARSRISTDLSTVRGLDLPLDRSLLTPVEEMEVIKARNTLIERCLARHGLTFAFPPLDPVRDAGRPRPYGLIDPAEAARFGYRDPAMSAPRDASKGARQPEPAVVAVITGTERGDVGGREVPSGGCAGEADRTLATDAQPGQEPVSFALSLHSHKVSGTTQPVTAAAAAWSTCMAEAGYDYKHPDAAINDPAFRAGRPSRREIAVATRDVECKERVDWIKTWIAVRRAVQNALIQEHATGLAREQQHKQRQLATAREVNARLPHPGRAGP